MSADPRAAVPSAALDLLEAGGRPDAAAVRAAWEAPGRRTHPEAPAAPGRAGSVALSLAAAAGERDAARYAWSDRVIGALERTKHRLGVPLERRLPAYRHDFERPGCPSCVRGFVELGEDGSRVAPCPACRAVRKDATS